MSLLDQASLVQIPSGYKAGKMYSQVPTDGTGDLDFSRSTTATRVNESGLIETVAINTPRIDFTGGGCGKYLFEPQRTNLALNSEDFSNASWSVSFSTRSSNVIISPSGILNADKLIENSTNNRHEIYSKSTISLNSGVAYTKSIYAKEAERSQISLNFVTGGFGQGSSVIANLSSGTLGVVSNYGGVSSSTATIKSVGSGWYRIAITMSPVSNGNFYGDFSTAFNGSDIYLGDGTSGVYIWGAQIEEGSYPTSYIPTSGSTVTRTQDISSTSGLSSVINSVEGVFMVEMAALADDGTFRLIELDNGTNANRVTLQYNSNNNEISSQVRSGSAVQAQLTYAVSDTTEMHKVAVRYRANDFSLWVDGVKRAQDTNGISFSASTLNRLVTNDGSGGNNFYGKLSELVLTEYLTDTQMAALTTLSNTNNFLLVNDGFLLQENADKILI